MTKDQIARINLLAALKREGRITNDEMAELAVLREQYLRELRGNLQAQLDAIYIQNEDGSYSKLEKKDTPGKENNP